MNECDKKSKEIRLSLDTEYGAINEVPFVGNYAMSRQLCNDSQ